MWHADAGSLAGNIASRAVVEARLGGCLGARRSGGLGGSLAGRAALSGGDGRKGGDEDELETHIAG